MHSFTFISSNSIATNYEWAYDIRFWGLFFSWIDIRIEKKIERKSLDLMKNVHGFWIEDSDFGT